ncbi:spore germination protein [Bacillus sp. JJ1764]|uniref:spore germination protein n=1 Tax=Bacillus sp. JJ1764 TaxID=3122964 RepID=UPI002FFFB5E0
MKTNPKDLLTTPQAVVILINYVLAAGILTLPRSSVDKVKTPDVWISVILGGLISFMAGFIMVKLSQQFPEKTFYQYSKEIIGKWLGAFLGLLMVGYFLALASYEVRTLAEVTGFFLLEGTPIWAIIMPFIWLGLYLIIDGINPIARLFEIIFPITVVVFLFVTFLSLGLFDLDNLRPVLGLGFTPVLKGVSTTVMAYLGPEIMLILVSFMQKPKKAIKVLTIGISICMFFYIITVVMVIGALSIDGTVSRTWPTIGLIRSFEIQGLIFERFESMLLVIWIMQIFATFIVTYYAATLGLAHIFNKKMKPFMFGVLPFIYIIARYPQNLNMVFKFGDYIGWSALFLFGGVPPLLFVISKLKGAKHEAKNS